MSDWRLQGQQRDLMGAHLTWHVYPSPGVRRTGHQCEFCWKKFKADGGELVGGYTTDDEKRWICEMCYWDFQDRFGWHVGDVAA